MDHARIAELTSNTEALRALVGRRVRYLGREYEISDLLLEDGLMILSSHEHSETQDDAYGRAHRLVPRQQKLKIRDAQGCPTHVWEDMIFLDGPVAG